MILRLNLKKLVAISELILQDNTTEFLNSRQQVLANSAIATFLILIVGIITNWEDRCLNSKESKITTALLGGIIGHYACCNGDTWSSELGILSDQQPRLITTFKVLSFTVKLNCGFLLPLVSFTGNRESKEGQMVE